MKDRQHGVIVFLILTFGLIVTLVRWGIYALILYGFYLIVTSVVDMRNAKVDGAKAPVVKEVEDE